MGSASHDSNADTMENGNEDGTEVQKYASPSLDSHLLRHSWTFWYMHRQPGAKIDDYSTEIHRIATVTSAEQFWSVYSRLKRPHEVPNVSDFHMFKEGIRPIWEDNINGGKWIVRLRKGLASRYWENLIMALVGDQFDVGAEISGAVISVRHSEDILSVWNQNAEAIRINMKIRDTLKRVLSLPPNCIVEYKAHKSSLSDASSFRNTKQYI
ncbi:translation initiation factor eIF 4e-like domain-containing protein [Cladochytrium replicatum]|nr:translation initiation factor eIF 4e-like domain-containing protein [Cladochytrium replicatum]